MLPVDIKIADGPSDLHRQVQPQPQVQTFSLDHLFRIVLRRRWHLIVPVGLFLALGVVYLLTTPKSHMAGSTILLDAGLNRNISQVGAMTSDSRDEQSRENARMVILSDEIALRVVRELDLLNRPGFVSPPTSLLERVRGQVMGTIATGVRSVRSRLIPPPPVDPGAAADAADAASATPEDAAASAQLQRERTAARILKGQLSVNRVGRSAAISINFVSRDQALAAEIVNAVANAYVQDVIGSNRAAIEQTTDWMRDRLIALELEAIDAAAAAEAFRVQNGLVTLRGSSLSEGSMTLLNTRLAEAVSTVASTRALLGSLDALIAAGPERLAEAGGAGAGSYLEGDAQELPRSLALARERVAQIERAIAETPNPPANSDQLDQARQQMARVAERLMAELRQRQQAVRLELDLAEANVTALGSSLGAVIDTTAGIGAAEIEYRALQQRAETMAAVYQNFLLRFQELEQQGSFPVSNLRVLALADLPLPSVGPGGRSTLLSSLVFGLMIGVMLLAYAEWRDRFLRSREDVIDDTGSAFLGYLPFLPHLARTGSPGRRSTAGAFGRVTSRLLGSRGAARTGLPAVADVAGAPGAPPVTQTLDQSGNIEVLVNPSSIYAETLRSIRLAADIKWRGEQGQVIGITAARPAEGKTTVALNLAAAIGLSGARVVLVDCDIRNPGLTRLLGVNGGAGLIEVLLGRTSPETALRPLTEAVPVKVLPCLPTPYFGQSAELLSSRGFHELLGDLRAQFDYVILDLSPLAPVIDARAMLRFLDHSVLVAGWGETPKTMLRRLIQSNPALQDRLLGTVLNRVDMAALPRYLDPASLDTWIGAYGDYIHPRSVPDRPPATPQIR
ncbi:MAG: AAA family ATPase [Rhodobacteraceae bacterium]|jgi:succinoglycan biosynthesis transport protein ExoP|nr:AAA family ATPase [Paracoccaceae bacterium]